MACNPNGGQSIPSSKLGLNLLWKKVQKNLKKKKISDVIKRIIPHRKPLTTRLVWYPKNVLSRDTSRHHCEQERTTASKLSIIIVNSLFEIQNVLETKQDITENLVSNGHGLKNTR